MNFYLDFLASLTFFLVPFLLGNALLIISRLQKNVLTAFVVGGLAVYLLQFFLDSLVPSNYWSAVLWLTFLAATFVNILSYKSKLSLKGVALPYIAITIFTALIYFFVWKSSTPYPMSVDWDIYEHITLANQI